MARPTKYTPEIAEKCFEAIRIGVRAKTLIAAYAGISVDSYDRWAQLYTDFADGIKRAEAHRTANALARIHKAMPKSWQAAAWLLERTNPEDYGRTISEQRHTITLKQTAQKLAEEFDLDPDEVLAEAERIFAESAR